jgi:hypothetical protein
MASDGLSSTVLFGGGVLPSMLDRSAVAAPVGDLVAPRPPLQPPIAVIAIVAATTRPTGPITL